MCGRFALETEAEVLAEQIELPDVPRFEPRYNIAAGQPVATVRSPEVAPASRTNGTSLDANDYQN